MICKVLAVIVGRSLFQAMWTLSRGGCLASSQQHRGPSVHLAIVWGEVCVCARYLYATPEREVQVAHTSVLGSAAQLQTIGLQFNGPSKPDWLAKFI